MNKIFPLKGKIQNYEWGGSNFIPDLLGLRSERKKYAEYWLGAHTNAPSEVTTPNGAKPLDIFLKNDLTYNLGTEVADKFGRLPFLFKVLDVRDMLSIQVHPTKMEAEEGFKRENQQGISLDAPNRNYKDDNHKPEVMVALSEFWLLHGFLPKDQMSQMLGRIPEFQEVMSVFEKEGHHGLYKKVMAQSVESGNRILEPLIRRILPMYEAGKLDKSNPDYWAARAMHLSVDKTNFDKGIFSIYFFNIVKLNKGEGVFQDAGVPHSYLEGQNIELMANSDNVLRAGLTSKHIDISELLKHVSFVGTVPKIMQGELQPDGIERIYRSSAPDFELSQIHLTRSKEYHSKATTAQIILIVEGEAEIVEGKESLVLEKGDASLIAADCEYQMLTPSSVIIYKATVR